jgi:hypothetical protein
VTAPDPDRLQRLLDSHQLTVLQLAELLDVEPSDLRLGLYVRSLPASTVARLADLLGESPTRPSAPPGSPADRAAIGAHLVGAPIGVTRDDLAHVLGWTLDRLERALRDLERPLGDVGIRVVAPQGRLRLVGRLEHLSPASRRRLDRHTAIDVPPQLATEVYRAMWWTPVYEQDLRARETALRHGLLAATARGTLRATEPVTFSLCLDQDDSAEPADDV